MGGPEDLFVTRKGMGLVNMAFSDEDISSLKGNLGIGKLVMSLILGQ